MANKYPFIQMMSLLQVNEEEITVVFTEHVEFLLGLLNQTNNVNNIHVRSIAARCLTEIELCFPVSIISFFMLF
jgi:hypothetical protein